MPFEVFKARVKIVRDEVVVKKWIEDQSVKTEYACLNMPEPLKLATREEVEAHFRATHKESIIKPVESHVVSGVACRSLRGGVGRVAHQLVLEQQRFPMQIATVLSQQFAQSGLQFFKVNKTVTHVAVARPHFLDLETTLVSDGVRNLVTFINTHPKCTRRQLIEALAPSPAKTPAATETSVATPADGGTTAPAAIESSEPTPEQTALISDLHWLVHQGHVIEFANGTLETAKKPAPRPPKPEKKTSPEPPPAEAVTPVTAPESPATFAPAPEAPVSGEAIVAEPPAAPEPPAQTHSELPPEEKASPPAQEANPVAPA
jgi:hypothetical protein